MPDTTPVAFQLYPPSRTESMSVRELNAVIAFATADVDNADTVYAGMSRADTVATAERTIRDVQAVLDASTSAARGESFLRSAFGKAAPAL